MGVYITTYLFIGTELDKVILEDIDLLTIIENKCEEEGLSLIVDGMCGEYVYIADILYTIEENEDTDEYCVSLSKFDSTRRTEEIKPKIQRILEKEEFIVDVFLLKHYH